MTLLDALGRPLGSLRLSVTDRCNMRCGYCMPNDHYVWLPRASILTFEELDRLAGVFAGLGARKVRLTGGEPLLRQHLDRLITLLSARREVQDIALTTNGILLAEQAETLAAAGLGRITVSLDTLEPARFKSFTRSDRHDAVLRGISAAIDAGFAVKLNTVVMRGYNDDEIVPLLRFARERNLELRFIEYMDVGGATAWQESAVVSREEILQSVGAAFGPVAAVDGRGEAPAEQFQLADGSVFGIIASTTAPFCGQCDRSRITADGTWFRCLYADDGLDLRTPLRDGTSDDDLRALIAATWGVRMDRGAEMRLADPRRGALYALDGLRADPRREMHTRGG